MSDRLTDIFSGSDEEISKETLLKYLNKDLPPDEMHRIEKMMLDSDLLNDAIEGLQDLHANEKIPGIEKEIESRLKKHLRKRDEKKMKRKIKELPWIYIFIVIIILLILISFAVIKSFL